MPQRIKAKTVSRQKANPGSVEKPPAPRSLSIAAKGIKTGNDFANLMSALMTDLIEGRIPPEIGNATCNAGGKLLKVVEMQLQYGQRSAENGPKVLNLAGGESAEQVQ